jgi:putative FmdB family regulatory protein
MPRYDYKCPACSFIEEYIHSMKEDPEFFCPKCNGQHIKMERQISFNHGSFIIKGGSVAKEWKEERYRLKRSADLGVRQIERYGSGPRVKPNVAGIEVDSWSDAAKMAKEAGLSAESYTPMIEKEKRVSKTTNIDESAWKKAKDVREST